MLAQQVPAAAESRAQGNPKTKRPITVRIPEPLWALQKRLAAELGGYLPGAANRIDSELIGMRWPDWRRIEQSTLAALRCRSAELVVKRGHGVLADAPRVVLLHCSIGRHHQRGRLPELQVVETAMPWTQFGLLTRPGIAVGSWMMICKPRDKTIGILSQRIPGAGENDQEADCREGFRQRSQHKSSLSK